MTSKKGPLGQPARKGGRKAYVPDAKTREQVEAMAGYGIAGHNIARVLKISESTLQKYFAEELALGSIKATAQVAASLFKQCLAGNASLIQFWLARREPEKWGAPAQEVKHSGAIGSYDLTKLTDKELDDFERLAKKAATAAAANPGAGRVLN